VACAADFGWAGWAAATLGWTLLDLRAAGPAAEVLERGLALAEQFGARSEIVRCLSQLAWARLLLGAHDEASALAARAEELLQRVSVPPGSAFLFGTPAYTAVARVLLANGEPKRGETLLTPVRDAAERSGWHEAAASSALVIGLCMEARGELDGATAALARAAELADDHGIPAPGWEAHAALARLCADGAPHLAAAAALVGRMTTGLTDEELRAGLTRHAPS
jgi:tetratricopeptide (TPR) repeat protein